MTLGGLYESVDDTEAAIRNYERVLALKNTYDPTNFFNQNANIKPAV